MIITKTAYYGVVAAALAAICIPLWPNVPGALMSFAVRAAILIMSGAVLVFSVSGIQARWLRLLAASLVSLRLLLVASLAAFLAWTMATAIQSTEPIYESLLRKQPDVMLFAVSRRATVELASGVGEVLLLVLILLAVLRNGSFTAPD